MNPFVTLQGSVTVSDDPQRAVWYSTNCHYWTDNWTKLRLVMHGLPVCLGCGSPGLQATFAPWWKAAEQHEQAGHPGYCERLKSWKEKCERTSKPHAGGRDDD